MLVDKKIEQLLEKKKKIDNEIEELKAKNAENLAKALCKLSDIEKLDLNVILGSVLKAVENVSNDEKEVLAKAGKIFLGKYKIIPSRAKNTKKKQNN